MRATGDHNMRPLLSWQFWAVLSAAFAAMTAIFAKIGIENIGSDFATFVRTLVIVVVVAAMLTLACCEVGYVIATEIRGGSNSTATVVFWLTAALLAGPPLGVAGAWAS